MAFNSCKVDGMTVYSYDSKSLLRDGKRWFPVMGEIHYSRYPNQYWKEALLKMKAGGVDLISSYVIWIHHEEIEGEWDFSGWRNLREFVQTVQACGLTMILRIGPWIHGEVRNGGFPDWLLAKHGDLCRTNNEAYFADVAAFYRKTFEQVQDLLLKNNGPIIGVQIENEYGHCGGLTGQAGEAHMKRLTALAKDIGFDVPLYTATGWGGAVTAGLLPVMGGYCEAPWDPRVTEIEPSGNYVFTYERNDHAIGSDFGLGKGVTFDIQSVPYLTAELGGGLQVSCKRRPVSRPRDIGAMSLAKMGSGCNLLGYYMYHGGTNPEGRLSTLEESKGTGSLNDMSVKNYDFRAPLGEYGWRNGAYDEIKLISLFVHDFGSSLCEMVSVIPEKNPAHPQNYTDLRFAWRFDTTSPNARTCGFLFVNNFQRRKNLASHDGVRFTVPAECGGHAFPLLDIYDGDFFVLPFNLPVGKSRLKTAAVSPLCVLHTSHMQDVSVFYTAAHLADLPKDYHMYTSSSVHTVANADTRLYQFDSPQEDTSTVITLSRQDALHAHVAHADGTDYLLITPHTFYSDSADDIWWLADFGAVEEFKTFPALPSTPAGFVGVQTESGFTRYERAHDAVAAAKSSAPAVACTLSAKTEHGATYAVHVCDWSQTALEDLALVVHYAGNAARLYQNGTLLDDAFFVGAQEEFAWKIGLKRWGKGAADFTLELDALQKDAPIFLESWPVFDASSVCELYRIEVVPIEKIRIH